MLAGSSDHSRVQAQVGWPRQDGLLAQRGRCQQQRLPAPLGWLSRCPQRAGPPLIERTRAGLPSSVSLAFLRHYCGDHHAGSGQPVAMFPLHQAHRAPLTWRAQTAMMVFDRQSPGRAQALRRARWVRPALSRSSAGRQNAGRRASTPGFRRALDVHRAAGLVPADRHPRCQLCPSTCIGALRQFAAAQRGCGTSIGLCRPTPRCRAVPRRRMPCRLVYGSCRKVNTKCNHAPQFRPRDAIGMLVGTVLPWLPRGAAGQALSDGPERGFCC